MNDEELKQWAEKMLAAAPQGAEAVFEVVKAMHQAFIDSRYFDTFEREIMDDK